MSNKRAVLVLVLIGTTAAAALSLAAVARSNARVVRETRAYFLGGRLLPDNAIELQSGRFDCGPIALRHVLRIHGIAPASLATDMPWTPEQIAAEARNAGVSASASQIPLNGLRNVNPPLIALMGTHYIVIERHDRDAYVVFDPGLGRMLVGPAYFARDWSGHVVLFPNARVPLALATRRLNDTTMAPELPSTKHKS